MNDIDRKKAKAVDEAAFAMGYESAQQQACDIISNLFPPVRNVESAARRLVRAAIRRGTSVERVARERLRQMRSICRRDK